MNRLIQSFFLLGCLAICASTTLAEEGSSEKELPQRGTLSTNMKAKYKSTGVESPWGQEGVISGGSPISGSVSQNSPKEWTARVFNNSEDTYSFSVKVVQYNDRGGRIKSDNFSGKLKGGQSMNRRISARPNTDRCDLELVNWRNLSPKKKEENPTN